MLLHFGSRVVMRWFRRRIMKVTRQLLYCNLNGLFCNPEILQLGVVKFGDFFFSLLFDHN